MDQTSLQKILDSAIPFLSEYGLKVVGAVVILIVGRIAAGIIARAAEKGMKRANLEPSLVGFLKSMTWIAVMTFVVIASLKQFGVETTSFVAVLGAAGFAIGFALQGSLSNFAAGVMILIFKPIRVGDLIKSCGYLGEVVDIGIFVTTINTLDHQKIIIPNGKLTGDVINNVNGNGIRRVDLMAGISYADDMQRAKELLQGVLADHPKVLAEPAPDVAVFELGDSSVNLVVRPWCKADDYWDVWFDVTQKTKEVFDANGISIPFPQRDVHLHQATNG